MRNRQISVRHLAEELVIIHEIMDNQLAMNRGTPDLVHELRSNDKKICQNSSHHTNRSAPPVPLKRTYLIE